MSELKRELWIIANEVATTIVNYNSLFCTNPDHPVDVELTKDEMDSLVETILKKVPGRMALEDFQDLLNRLQEKRISEYNDSN